MSLSRLELITDALKLCAEQHSHIFSRFTAVDSKAQGTVTAAGALLAATLAFIAQSAFTNLIHRVGGIATFAAATVLALATASIVFSFLALEVKPARAAFRGDIVAKTVLQLLLPANANALTNDVIIEAHYYQQLARWPDLLSDLTAVLNSKARRVLAAQACVSAAAIAIATFAGIVLFS